MKSASPSRSDWVLYANATISVSVKEGDDPSIEDEDRITAAFSAAEQAVRNALDRERFSVESDL